MYMYLRYFVLMGNSVMPDSDQGAGHETLCMMLIIWV